MSFLAVDLSRPGSLLLAPRGCRLRGRVLTRIKHHPFVYRVVFEQVEYSAHSNQSGDASDVQLIRCTAASKNRLLVFGCRIGCSVSDAIIQLNQILASEVSLVPGHDVPLNVSIEVDLVL